MHERGPHQLLALKMLCAGEQVALFQNSRGCSFSTKDLTRIGIMRVNCEGKPHFIRRTFAEYYVEDYLVIRLTKGNSTSQQVHTFVLKYVFLEQYYHVIRIVIVELLSRSKPSQEASKQYGNHVHDLGK